MSRNVRNVAHRAYMRDYPTFNNVALETIGIVVGNYDSSLKKK